MRFGYYILPQYLPALEGAAGDMFNRYFDQVAAAEAAGFDSLWATEHHFSDFGGLSPNPQLLLTAISQRTRRLRLGTAVSVLPLHNPVQIAEDFAMLDVLSGGRVEFGVGRGMAVSGYAGYGSDWTNAQDRLKEALALIERVWTEPRVSFTGRYYACENVTLTPRPVQQPHPPIWVTASLDPDSFEWIGAQGYDVQILPWLFPSAADNIHLYRAARAAAGHAGPGRVMAMYPTHVAETSAVARASVAPAWERWRQLVLPEVVAAAQNRPAAARMFEDLTYDRLVSERHALCGSVDDCLAGLRWIAATFGATHIGCTFYFGGLPHDRALRSIELFGRAVIPALQASAAASATT